MAAAAAVSDLQRVFAELDVLFHLLLVLVFALGVERKRCQTIGSLQLQHAGEGLPCRRRRDVPE
jgi:hypothetical protein